MRHDKIIAAGPIGSARPHPFVFVCTCCEIEGHAPEPVAPAGWAIEYIDGRTYALCDDCKIDLPDADRPAGAMSTRVGVTSPLDAAEQFEWDEDDIRHAQRMIGIARAEQIGRQAMPLMLVAILAMSGVAMLAQGTKWITM
jgi:hypothetical protein